MILLLVVAAFVSSVIGLDDNLTILRFLTKNVHNLTKDRFQDHYLEIQNFYQLDNNVQIPTNELSVCARIRFDILSFQSVFTVTLPNSGKERRVLRLTFRTINGGGVFFVGMQNMSVMIDTSRVAKMVPKSWTNFCFSIQNGGLRSFINGMFIDEEAFGEMHVSGLGSVIRDRPLLLGYDPTRSEINWKFMYGSLSELYMSHSGLSDEAMMAITGNGCHKAIEYMKQVFFNWEEALSTVSSSNPLVARYSSRMDNLCQDGKWSDGGQLIPFPYTMTFTEALSSCRGHGGQMAAPTSSEEVKKMMDFFKSQFEAEFDQVCSKHFWAGLVQSKEDVTVWNNVNTDRPLSNITWGFGQPNGKRLQKCGKSYSNPEWSVADIECTNHFCHLCNVQESGSPFVLRGLPWWIQELGVDLLYSFSSDQEGNDNRTIQQFLGYISSRIVWDGNEERWEILPYFGNQSPMGWIKSKNPFGFKQWTFKAINSEQIQIPLKLTRCSRDQFTCHQDGECISVELRCDGSYDCPGALDISDENNCSILELNSGYNKVLPPENEGGGKIPLSLSLNVAKISSIEEINMEFSVIVKVHLHWTDSRLWFRNLKHSHNKNLIPHNSDGPKQHGFDDLWSPFIKFRNSVELSPEVIPENDLIFVSRKGEAKHNLMAHYDEEYMFEGGQNPISLGRSYKVKLTCNFELGMFPFDNQKCPIIIGLPTRIQDYVELKIGNAIYSGPEIASQYSISGIEFKTELKEKDNSTMAVAIIKAQRIPTYHLAITFLPSLCLVAIAEVTLFIDVGYFEATIMVALTTMLVMYTLYQSITNMLPQTPYLKMIDIWLLNGFLIPFVVFILIIVSDIVSKEASASATIKQISVTPFNSARRLTFGEIKPLKANAKKKKILKIVKCLIPISTLCFIATYFFVAMSNYGN